MEDILLLFGILLILIPTFVLNIIVGCYFLGILFILFAIGLAKLPKHEKNKK